jgi:uncharacterized phage-associated protein
MKSVTLSTSFPFDAQKATEVAATFLKRERGGTINVMKVVKLMYLLDRESIARRGVPVVGGAYLSMRNGPVTSEVLDLINAGALWNSDTTWAQFISDRENHEIGLRKDPGTDRLSEFELELIAELFRRHEGQDQWQLAEWCHAHCGEWLPLDRGCEPITVAELAGEVGREPSEVIENAAEANLLAEVFG